MRLEGTLNHEIQLQCPWEDDGPGGATAPQGMPLPWGATNTFVTLSGTCTVPWVPYT